MSISMDEYKLTVLDYNSGNVFIYTVYEDLTNEEVEEFLTKKGFRIDETNWMISEKKNFEIFEES